MKRSGPGDPSMMGFLEHLDELRVRLIRAVLAVVIAVGVCWSWAPQILHFIMEPLRAAQPGVRFIYTGPTEGFVLHMKAALFAGVFLAAPFVLYQVWAFISPGLYSHEKRYVVPFVMFGSLFFVAGGVFGHVIMFPATFRFLGQFTSQDIEYLPRLTEYFSFYSWFVVGLGAVFQLPVVIFVLSRIGLVTPAWLLRNFKYAVLAAFVVSAVITPSADIVNQTMVAAPIVGLYLLGIGVAWLFGRPRRLEGSDLVVLALGAVATSQWSQRALERGARAEPCRPERRLAA
jgi:sec-independent protein translocase protein TatC